MKKFSVLLVAVALVGCARASTIPHDGDVGDSEQAPNPMIQQIYYEEGHENAKLVAVLQTPNMTVYHLTDVQGCEFLVTQVFNKYDGQTSVAMQPKNKCPVEK